MFPHIFPRLVTVGEETGNLHLALNQIADHVEKQAGLGEKVRKALGYPAFVALVGMVAGFFLLTYSLPAMMGIFKEFGAKLPITVRILMAVSDFMQAYGMLGMGAVTAVGVALFLYFRSPRGTPVWDRLVLRLPLAGRVVWLRNMFHFTSTVHTLLAAGLPLTDALEMTARATGNSRIRDAILHTRNGIIAGQSFSEALATDPIFPDLIRQMANVGEESGTLAENLATLSNFYEQETERAVSGLTDKIEPTLILLVGGVVGFIAVAIMSTIYGVMGQIK